MEDMFLRAYSFHQNLDDAGAGVDNGGCGGEAGQFVGHCFPDGVLPEVKRMQQVSSMWYLVEVKPMKLVSREKGHDGVDDLTDNVISSSVCFW